MDYLILQAEKNSLTVAHFDISRRTSEVVGAVNITLGEEHSFADAVKSVAEKITGSPRVIICLPPEMFAQRTLQLPLDSLNKVREITAAHIQGDSALPVEELVIDVMAGGANRFIAVMARKTELIDEIARFTEAGIEPHIMSSVPFAVGSFPGLPSDCAVYDGSTLTFISAGTPTYFKTSGFAGDNSSLNTALTALELSGLSMPPQLFLIGEGRKVVDDGTPLVLPVVHALMPDEYAAVFKTEAHFQELAGLYSVAVAADNRVLPDFRRGELAWTSGNDAVKRKLRVTAVLCVIIAILLFVAKAIQYRAAAAELASINKSISLIYREVFPTRTKVVDELSEIKGEIRKLSGAESSAGVLDVLKRLSEIKGSGISALTEVELEGKLLRIKGEAVSAKQVDEFKNALGGILTTVESGEIKSRPDGMVNFVISGTVRDGVQ